MKKMIQNEVAQVSDNAQMEIDMRLGMKRGEFKLVYQPLRRMSDGACTSAEGLLRWDHPTQGPISPARFIPVAEECGLIQELGKWVIREACGSLSKLASQGWDQFKIAVNFSPKQFADPDLLRGLRRAIIINNIDPTCLGVEMTESCAMLNMEDALSIVKELRGYGMQISLDDFGTGYSSLSHLRRFPLDIVKLDKSFIDELTQSLQAATIVASVVSLAHSLGLKVTAEGVETVQQHRLLTDMGCDFVQGYLVSRPLEFDALKDFIACQNPSPGSEGEFEDEVGVSSDGTFSCASYAEKNIGSTTGHSDMGSEAICNFFKFPHIEIPLEFYS